MVGTQSGYQLEKDEVKHGFVLCFVGVILHVHVGEEVDIGAGAQRVDDLAGLGDWTVNEKKLGMPLSQVAEKIRALGMKFGIWIEPEMVCEDSDLYREHPDWAFTIPGRKPVRAISWCLIIPEKKWWTEFLRRLQKCSMKPKQIMSRWT